MANSTKKKSAKKSSAKKKPASATATSIERLQEENTAQNGKRQVRAVVLFLTAVFLMCVAIISSPEKNLWNWLHSFMFGIFGICAYIMPVILAAVAVLGAMEKYSGMFKSRLIESGFLVWFICSAVDIFSNVSESAAFIEHIKLSYACETVHGGVFGALLGHPMFKLLGKTGAKITVVILIVGIIMLITGTTLISAYKMLSAPLKTAGHAIENRMEEHEKRRREEEHKPRFNPDVPLPGDEKTENPLTDPEINEKGKRVIKAYRGEQTEEPETLPAETTAPTVKKDDTEVSAQKSDLPHLSVEVPQKAEKRDEGDTDEKKDVAAQLPEGLSLKDIPEDENAYRFPPITLLREPAFSANAKAADFEATGEQLVNILRSFGVETKILNISVGPSITRYELQPAAGVKISKITNLADDIAMNLASAGVRIEAPIPNKPAVGIEVPHKNSNIVTIREIIDSKQFTSAKSKLTVALGKDISGTPIVTDIAKMPHGLIAGATGSGKSVCINSIIMSLLYNSTPDEVKLLLIDPKVVELGIYNAIPHLLVPVVTDPRKASGALGWAVMEMERRYKIFADNDVRNLEGYNTLAENDDDLIKMPHIVIVIDELADLMMTAPHEVEDSICRIAQKARAAGMHLLIATQRPSADVITGLIKANVPSRIAFMVSSSVDSRIILDMGGAEKLLGKGDMLFAPVGAIKPKRIQGCFVSDAEVEAVVEYIKGMRTEEYDADILDEIERQANATKKGKDAKNSDDNETDADPMLNAALECVVENGQASTSLLQRRLKLGYARAARIMDQMAERNYIGPYEGSKPRAVLITKAQLMEMQARTDETAE